MYTLMYYYRVCLCIVATDGCSTDLLEGLGICEKPKGTNISSFGKATVCINFSINDLHSCERYLRDNEKRTELDSNLTSPMLVQ